MGSRNVKGLATLSAHLRGRDPCWTGSWALARPLSSSSAFNAADDVEKEGGRPEGPKAKLLRILGAAEEPLTADEVWEKAKGEGLASKNFTKKMLKEMKDWGRVNVKPGKGNSFVYRLSPSFNPAKRLPSKTNERQGGGP
eukprot:jgi/Botrbrau1/4798/Bobra.0325s0020.1